ncbi:MAG: AraC family transcriptional regulator [Bacteroidales bacterium]|nr:AraC family transcriptional regulator [Bacteroidales bacterium]
MIRLKDGFKGSRLLIVPPPVQRALAEDPFTSRLYVTDIGHFPHARHHYRNRPEGTDAFILLYCIDGYGWVDYKDERYQLGPGESFIIPAGAPHTYGADEQHPWTLYWVHFKGELAPYFSRNCDRVCKMADPDHDRITGRTTLFEELYLALDAGFGDTQLRYACATLYHFLGTFQYLQAGLTLQQGTSSGLGIIENCRTYMQEHLEQRITLDDICRFTGYKPAHCASIFKQNTGMTPIAYLQELRIRTAMQLFDTTDLKINQICHKVGIEDPYYFSRLFRKRTGLSPSAWRRQGKKQSL